MWTGSCENTQEGSLAQSGASGSISWKSWCWAEPWWVHKVSQAKKGEKCIWGKGCKSRGRTAWRGMVGTGDHKQLEVLELKVMNCSSSEAGGAAGDAEPCFDGHFLNHAVAHEPLVQKIESHWRVLYWKTLHKDSILFRYAQAKNRGASVGVRPGVRRLAYMYLID